MFNPFFEAGFAWDLGGGWGFSSFNGGYGPIDNELRGTNDIWVYNNRTWLGWSGNLWNSGLKDGSTGPKFTFAAESVYGLTGDNLQTHSGFSQTTGTSTWARMRLWASGNSALFPSVASTLRIEHGFRPMQPRCR